MKLTFSTAFLVYGTLFAAMPVVPGGAILDNDQVKVVRALEKAHVKGKVHEHKPNRVMIYLQAGEQHFEYQDGRKAETFHWTPGQVVWSPASGTHQPEVTGDDSFNIVEVELKKPGTGQPVTTALDPVKIDPKHYSLEFENDQVRVVRVKIGAHEMTPSHEHPCNRVTVYLSDQQFRVTSADGKAQSVEHKAGDSVWSTPITHKEENVGDKPFEALMVEIKS